MASKKRVLILCTGNSCRSQMAEAIWRHEAGDDYEAVSAGTQPSSVHPRAEAVLKEIGVSTEGLWSKSIEVFAGQHFDLIITVCDHARDTCPVWPGHGEKLHWPFEDPAHATGSEEEILSLFRLVRDQIRERIQSFLAQS